MRIYFAFIMVFLSGTIAFAANYEKYDWEPNRKPITLSAEEQNIPLLVLKHYISYEYIYEGADKDLYIYLTEHKIIKANNHEAIEKSNKISIPMADAVELVNIKARSLNPDGKVVEVDQNNIKEIKDEETDKGFKIFAIEGAEVGSEIEFLYTKKIDANYFGRVVFQNNVPVKNSTFRLICPENLQFTFKSYNGMSEVQEKDTINGKRFYEADADLVPALHQEKFSSYDNNLQRVEFKLTYNSFQGKGRLLTWADAAKRIYDGVCAFDKEELKASEKILKEIKLNDYNTETEKAGAIEDYIKTNYYQQKDAPDAAENLTFILKNRYGNERGITRLYCALLQQANIPYELALTSSRNDIHFDGAFESWNYLSNYLIYFPDINQYLGPNNFELRFGMIPPEFTETDALFIKPAKIRDFEVGLADIKHIPAVPYNINFDNLNIKVQFDQDFTNTSVDLERNFGGYNAGYTRNIYPMLEEDKKKAFLEDMVKYFAPDAAIEKLEISNEQNTFANRNKPFVVDAAFKAPSFIESAGNIILFNIGEIIGPQTELYQEEQRKTRVENDFNREYVRKIQVIIPNGYHIKNPEDLNMDIYAVNQDERVYSFTSSYTLESQTLNVTIDEYYKKIYYPIDKFEDFRKVVNAAADWNKITLVLAKN